MTAQLIYSPDGEWRPRHYYIFKNKTSGKLYVGQKMSNIDNYLGSGSYWINHCEGNGGYSKKNIEVVWVRLFICETSAKNWLNDFEKQNPNYYLQENTKWANQIPENTLNTPFQNLDANARVELGKRISETMMSESWKNQKETSIIKQKETKSNPAWKETIGKESIRKRLEKMDYEDVRRKQVKNTDYSLVGKKASETKMSESWKNQRETSIIKQKETKSSPKWIAENTFVCDVCSRSIVGKTNVNRWHNENCRKR